MVRKKVAHEAIDEFTKRSFYKEMISVGIVGMNFFKIGCSHLRKSQQTRFVINFLQCFLLFDNTIYYGISDEEKLFICILRAHTETALTSVYRIALELEEGTVRLKANLRPDRVDDVFIFATLDPLQGLVRYLDTT